MPEVGRSAPASGPPEPARRPPWRRRAVAYVRRVNAAISEGDNARIEAATLQLSRSRRPLAPLALVVGAVIMLFEGLRLLVSNWRLTLVQLLPAMWIWAAMFDLKLHLLYGHSFRSIRGVLLVPIVAGVTAITAASFFLNATFAFAIARPGRPAVRDGFAQARARLPVVLGWGFGVGLALGVATAVVPRFGLWWFTFSVGTVVAVMMVCYVAVPGRLIGVKPTYTRRDKLAATAVGGVVGFVVCSPSYILGRIGLLMLGSHVLFIPGVFVLALGVTLQAGTTTAVKTVKLGARLMGGDGGPPSTVRPLA